MLRHLSHRPLLPSLAALGTLVITGLGYAVTTNASAAAEPTAALTAQVLSARMVDGAATAAGSAGALSAPGPVELSARRGADAAKQAQRIAQQNAAAEAALAAERQAAAARAAEAARVAAAAREAAAARQAAAERASRSAMRDPRSIGRAMAASRGWGADQFDCLDKLWSKESGWNVHADNPSSSAYGIPQALPGSKMASIGPDWRTNPATQIAWGLSYVQGRYGTPCSAWAHSRSANWY